MVSKEVIGRATRQMQEWMGQFGKEYTDRNALSLLGMESLYKERYGITRTEMNSRFIGDLDRNISILEIGSNVGNQLLCSQEDGFKNLYGIEIGSYAIKLLQNRTTGISIIQASAFHIPFKNNSFELVFTSGVLIHIAPSDINKVLDEMYRCTRRYIWCFEYCVGDYVEVDYRGHNKLLWRADYPRLFLERFNNLELVKEERFKYLSNDNVDTMFLLRKGYKNNG